MVAFAPTEELIQRKSIYNMTSHNVKYNIFLIEWHHILDNMSGFNITEINFIPEIQ